VNSKYSLDETIFSVQSDASSSDNPRAMERAQDRLETLRFRSVTIGPLSNAAVDAEIFEMTRSSVGEQGSPRAYSKFVSTSKKAEEEDKVYEGSELKSH
jgi:hypothetical protein